MSWARFGPGVKESAGKKKGKASTEHGNRELVLRINHEALHLSRLAGDYSMELLILQNMSMHAGHLGRPVEALRIARMVLEPNTLSPRLEALFRTREARALALAGDETTAKRSTADSMARHRWSAAGGRWRRCAACAAR